MKNFIYNNITYSCPVELTLDQLSGKYKSIILWRLHQHGILRFGQLKKLLPASINDNSLSRQLRELLQSNLINRTDYRTIPPKVEYSLSPKGRQLVPALEIFRQWGMNNFESPSYTSKDL